jgi:hypothetical protein
MTAVSSTAPTTVAAIIRRRRLASAGVIAASRSTGDGADGGSAVTLAFAVSTPMLTALGAAISLVDPRQTARRQGARRIARDVDGDPGYETVVTKVVLYKRPNVVRRFVSLVGLGVMSVGSGLVLATALAGTLFFASLWLRDAIR